MRSIVATCILMVTLAAAAQNNGGLAGIVRIGDDPVPGVTVTVRNPALKFSRTVVTDIDGRFVFSQLPAGSGYRIVGELEGAVPAKRSRISVEPGLTQNLELSLKLRPTSGCCWIVTIPPPPEPGTYVITREMIERLPL